MTNPRPLKCFKCGEDFTGTHHKWCPSCSPSTLRGVPHSARPVLVQRADTSMPQRLLRCFLCPTTFSGTTEKYCPACWPRLNNVGLLRVSEQPKPPPKPRRRRKPRKVRVTVRVGVEAKPKRVAPPKPRKPLRYVKVHPLTTRPIGTLWLG